MQGSRLTVTPVSSPLKAAFSISRGSKTSAETVRATLEVDGARGRGECVPYARYGETLDGVASQIEALRGEIAGGLTREALQDALPAGAARCALDCAFWDLEAKRAGASVWRLAGLPEPRPFETALTLALDTPEDMANAAKRAHGRLLKLKLGGPGDLSRVEAVRAARPDARLILDANEGLSAEDFPAVAARAAELGVVLIEQPFPAGQEAALVRRAAPVGICADESAHTSAEIDRLARAYDAVNIKLDKAGGLTEALRMARQARRAGLGVMIGCMVAGSLSMAPAALMAGLADAVDLDGPLWLAEDVPHGLVYAGARVSPPSRELWG